MNEKSFLALLLFLFVLKIESQEFPKIIPPSPTATSFHVYGNNTVNYYSGSINVSIPIYTINEGDLSIPITLNYNAGNGIRVDEQASWVGLGWTLNTGGVISRVKRGVADDAPIIGFMSYDALPKAEYNANGSPTNLLELQDIYNGKKDGEPDKFMYNSPSTSGAFFINYDEQIHLKPFKNIKVDLVTGGTTESLSSTNCNAAGNLKNSFSPMSMEQSILLKIKNIITQKWLVAHSIITSVTLHLGIYQK